MAKKIVRRGFLGLCAVAGVAVLALAVFKAQADSRYYDDYDPALPFNVQVQEDEIVDDTVDVFGIERPRHFRRVKFTFEARNGEPVPSLLALPTDFEGRLPAVVFVHGSRQEKEFIDEIATPFAEAGFAMASYDQYMQGERPVDSDGLAEGLAWRTRTWKTVNDARRMVDYLQTRDDIDPDRIYLVGASYGAITGTVALAREPRFKAGVLVVGGGHVPTLLDAPMIREEVPGAVLAVAKPLIHWLMGVADPVRHAAGTAGTPVLMQNGSADRVVSPESGERLYESLGEPKSIEWYDIDHPGLRDGDGPEIGRMLDDGLEWLQAQDQAVLAQLGRDTPAQTAASVGEPEAS